MGNLGPILTQNHPSLLDKKEEKWQRLRLEKEEHIYSCIYLNPSDNRRHIFFFRKNRGHISISYLYQVVNIFLEDLCLLMYVSG